MNQVYDVNRKETFMSGKCKHNDSQCLKFFKGKVSLLGALLFLLFCHKGYAEAFTQKGAFKAGASMNDITPYLGGGIVGNFGVPPAAEYVHDPLYARVLVLDDGTTKLVFVVLDNIGASKDVYDHAKQLISERTGISPEHVMTASTHTHSAISAGGTGTKRRGWNKDEPLDGYQQFIAQRVADGVDIALQNLEPALIGWGTVDVPQHVFNRRWRMREPVINPFGQMEAVRFNPGVLNPDAIEPVGPTDPEVTFISVQATNGRPIALLANYSLHYVGGIPRNHISADYFGVFSDRIQELLNADRQDIPFVGIMSNGTSGDINNINVMAPPENNAPYLKMKKVAKDVAQAVYRVYQTTTHVPWVKLQARQKSLSLDVRQVDKQLLELVDKINSLPEGSKPIHHPLEKEYAKRVLQHANEWPKQLVIDLQAFRLGDIGVTAIPFETFAETGLELKSKTPLKHTFNISFANGTFGYLPTPQQHDLGGYETWMTTSRVEKNASVKIVDTLMELLNTMATDQVEN